MALTNKEKVIKLEDKGFNYFEIAEILDISYEEVRAYFDKEE